jgi:hypothetical protein
MELVPLLEERLPEDDKTLVLLLMVTFFRGDELLPEPSFFTTNLDSTVLVNFF